MTNKLAPYKNPAVMAEINAWWTATYPNNTTLTTEVRGVHAIDLYRSFVRYTYADPAAPDRIDANQFIKCLTAYRVADAGGYWVQLPSWEPKEYEIRQAKVY